MTVLAKQESKWRDCLEIEEAKEVTQLDIALEALATARRALKVRHEFIRNKAHMRYVWRQKQLKKKQETRNA